MKVRPRHSGSLPEDRELPVEAGQHQGSGSPDHQKGGRGGLGALRGKPSPKCGAARSPCSPRSRQTPGPEDLPAAGDEPALLRPPAPRRHLGLSEVRRRISFGEASSSRFSLPRSRIRLSGGGRVLGTSPVMGAAGPTNLSSGRFCSTAEGLFRQVSVTVPALCLSPAQHWAQGAEAGRVRQAFFGPCHSGPFLGLIPAPGSPLPAGSQPSSSQHQRPSLRCLF